VRSVRGTRWWRRAWYALTLPLLAPVVLYLTNFSSVTQADSAAGPILLALASAGLVIGAVMTFAMGVTEDGVRLSVDGRRWRTRHDEHDLKFPGKR
jgi:hypothetical protein